MEKKAKKQSSQGTSTEKKENEFLKLFSNVSPTRDKLGQAFIMKSNRRS